MNQKELADKAREMQKDFSNSEIAEKLGVRLEDLTAALTYRDPAVKVPMIAESVALTVETVDEKKTKARKKKS